MVKYEISQSNVPWKVFVRRDDDLLIELDKDEVLKRISDNKRKSFEAYGRTFIDGHSRYATSYIEQMRREEERYQKRLHEEWKRDLDDEDLTANDELKAIRDKYKPILEKARKKGYYGD